MHIDSPYLPTISARNDLSVDPGVLIPKSSSINTLDKDNPHV